MNLKINRNTTNALQGLAILFMVFHHLFITISSNPFIVPVFGINSSILEQFMASTGKLCVPLFMLLSGYGFSRSNLSDKRLVTSLKRYSLRLLWFLISFWVAIIATVILFLLFQQPIPLHGPGNWFLTMFGLDVTLNGTWWYVPVYAMVLLLMAFLDRKLRTISWRVLLFCSAGLYILSSYTNFPYVGKVLEKLHLFTVFRGFYAIDYFLGLQWFFVLGFLAGRNLWIEITLEKYFAKIKRPIVLRLVVVFLLSLLLLFRYNLADIQMSCGIIKAQDRNNIMDVLYNSRLDFVLLPVCALCFVMLGIGKARILSCFSPFVAAIWFTHGTFISFIPYVCKHLLGISSLSSFVFFLLVIAISLLYAIPTTWFINLVHSKCNKTVPQKGTTVF